MIFTSSQEARRLGDPIIRLFLCAFGRQPDMGALQTFSAAQRRGDSVHDMARAIAGSTEFLALHGTEAVPGAAMIDRMARFALGLPVTMAVRSALLGAAAAGASRSDILVQFAELPEVQVVTDITAVLFPGGLTPENDLAYQFWLEEHGGVSDADSLVIERHIARMVQLPRISLLMSGPAIRPDLLLETIASLDRQLYPHWELCVACPHDMPPAVRLALNRQAGELPGIRLIDSAPPLGHAGLLQTALTEATGTFVAFIDPGDQLAPTALYDIAAALERNPDLDVLYTDEDTIDGAGTRSRPLFKAGWGADMLLLGDAIGQLLIVRRSHLDKVGGVRADSAPFTAYDLALRVTAGLAAGAIQHVARVCFHRGRLPGRILPFPLTTTTSQHTGLRRTLQRYLDATGDATLVQDSLVAGGLWPRPVLPRRAVRPSVSILIPTHDQPEHLSRCVDGLLRQTDYPAVQILIADHDNRLPAARQVLRRLQRHKQISILPVSGPFNWSAINNRLAAKATGDVLVLMNDDVGVMEPGWLDELVAQLERPGTGIAGPCLLYPDGTLQHGGIVLGNRTAKHILRSSRDAAGYMGQLAVPRELSAVTGACLAIWRPVFEEAGGLDERMAVAASDVDLCLRVRARGYRVVWTPHAVLSHVDGATRGADTTIRQQAVFQWEMSNLKSAWATEMLNDPFLNANLRATDYTILLATPPRRAMPWTTYDVEAAE